MKKKIQFLKKFHFQYSHLIGTKDIQLCKILVKNKKTYTTHRKEVRKISTLFQIRLKPEAKQQTQRTTEVSYHYREKLKSFLHDLQKME